MNISHVTGYFVLKDNMEHNPCLPHHKIRVKNWLLNDNACRGYHAGYLAAASEFLCEAKGTYSNESQRTKHLNYDIWHEREQF